MAHPPKKSKNQGIWIWRRGKREPIQLAAGLLASPLGALSPDGKHVIARFTIELANYIRLYSVASGKLIWSERLGLSAAGFEFSTDGKKVAMAIARSQKVAGTHKRVHKNREIAVLSLKDLKLSTLVTNPPNVVWNLHWGADGKHLFYYVSGGGLGTWIQWIKG